MSVAGLPTDITRHLIESLYLEAMILADEARHYFEEEAKQREPGLTPAKRVEMSCESLRLTTRLMHSIAWLLNQKAYFAGELSYSQLRGQGRMLGESSPSQSDVAASLPEKAQQLIRGSEDLFARIKRLELNIQRVDMGLEPENDTPKSRVHQLQQELLTALTR